MQDFCGRPWDIASLSISINFKNFDYEFGLDKYGNLKLLRSYEEEIPCNGRAKFHVSSRWVRSEMARREKSKMVRSNLVPLKIFRFFFYL